MSTIAKKYINKKYLKGNLHYACGRMQLDHLSNFENFFQYHLEDIAVKLRGVTCCNSKIYWTQQQLSRSLYTRPQPHNVVHFYVPAIIIVIFFGALLMSQWLTIIQAKLLMIVLCRRIYWFTAKFLGRHYRSRSLCPVFKGAYLRSQPVLHSTSMLRRSDHENLTESPAGRLPGVSRWSLTWSLLLVAYLHPATSYKYSSLHSLGACPMSSYVFPSI